MPSRSGRPRKDDPATPVSSEAGGDGEDREPEGPQTAIPDLSALPIAGIGRRQLGLILGAVATVWIVVLFAHQIGDASAASTKADDLAVANEKLRNDIEGYRRELALIQRQEYILIEARGYGLGKGREIPFAFAQDAPSLPPDAPGSAAVRVGAAAEQATPFERWMELLFGPG